MPEFDNLKPGVSVTDPKGVALSPELKGAPLPAHLYKHVAEKSDTSLVVAWKGKEPIHNESVIVGTEAEKAERLADGYSAEPVLSAPAAAKKNNKKDE
jgi:hypothetical protein